MGVISFTGWPPSTNSIWRQSGGHIYLTPKAERFRAAIRQLVILARRDGDLPEEPFEGPLAVSIELVPPDRRKRDIDNTLKAGLDALTHAGVWLDDSQVKDLHLTMAAEPVKGGHVTISIREIV